MKQLQSFQNRFAKRILKAKVMSAEALRPCSSGTQLHARHVSNQYCLEQDALKGEIPEHLDVFSSTMSQLHGYD